MVYNVNAARALRNEAAGETWPVEVDGAVYQLPREVPFEFMDRIEEFNAVPGVGGIRLMLQALLGPEQAEAFPFGTLSGQDLVALFEAYQGEVNVSLGESQGSSPSSTSTAKPSKQTSKRSTASGSRTSTKARSAGGASKS